jgi:hypothetical protein
LSGVSRLIANRPHLAIVESAPEVRAFPSASMTRPRQYYDLSDTNPKPPPLRDVGAATSDPASPDYPHHLSNAQCPIPRQTRQVRISISSLPTRPSPSKRRVGICIDSFETGTNFTHVTAHWIARPPMAAFITRLLRINHTRRLDWLLGRPARGISHGARDDGSAPACVKRHQKLPPGDARRRRDRSRRE